MKKILKILLLIIGIVYTREYPALWVLIITYIIYNYFSGTAAKVYNFLEKNVAKLFNIKRQNDIKNIQVQIQPLISFYIKAYISVWDTWPTKLTLIDYDYYSIRNLIENEKHIDTQTLSDRQFKDMIDEQIFIAGYSLFKRSFENLLPVHPSQGNAPLFMNANQLIQKYYDILGQNKFMIPYLTKYANEHGIEITEGDIKNRISDLNKNVAIKNRSADIKASIISNKPIISNMNIHHMDTLDGVQFEKVLGRLFEQMGYEVQFTKVTGDQGADLLLSKAGEKKIVQAKRYKNTVSNSAVQEAVAAKAFYGYDHAAVATNNYFTEGAIALAQANGVELIDRDTLKEWLHVYPIHRQFLNEI